MGSPLLSHPIWTVVGGLLDVLRVDQANRIVQEHVGSEEEGGERPDGGPGDFKVSCFSLGWLELQRRRSGCHLVLTCARTRCSNARIRRIDVFVAAFRSIFRGVSAASR